MALDGESGEAIGHNQGQIACRRLDPGQDLTAAFVELASEVRPLQVGRPVRSGGMQADHRSGLNNGSDRGGQVSGFQAGMHGIARLGMGELKSEHIAGLQTDAGAAQSHARRRQCAKPGGEGGPGKIVHARSSLSGSPASNCSRPKSSPPSQASNSGAGRSPSTRRR